MTPASLYSSSIKITLPTQPNSIRNPSFSQHGRPNEHHSPSSQIRRNRNPKTPPPNPPGLGRRCPAAHPLLRRDHRWASNKPLQSLEQAERWLRARALGPDVHKFAIELRPDHSQPDGNNANPTLIGVMGSHVPPRIGYLIHAGYATEALRALVSHLFTHIPSSSSGDGNGGTTGLDYLEALTVTANAASQNVLRKCGFTYCETLEGEFESWSMGLCDSAVYRIARPGMTLEQLGLLSGTEATVEENMGGPLPIQ
ncbi:Uu.00g068630.m01.CDS01 [Anthostomella pinea]|uniref:Uu.00g068630.m01.CDS01 n=1 Tax=Anthostomella pinea TaxID=933095 RepID=A0AAI8YNG5_9PEZI|nr:Uu.00g068630.m01.CDS01 [Anthostomella pinea]